MLPTGRISLPLVLKTVLTIAWYLVLILAAAFIVEEAYGVLSGRLADEGMGFSAPVFLSENAYQIVGPGAGEASLSIHKLKVLLDIRSPGILLIIGNYLSKLLSIGVVMLVVFLLRAVFRTVTAGEPFSPRNAGRIRTVGIVLIVMNVVEALIRFGVSSHIVRSYEATGLVFGREFPIDIPLLFVGLSVIVLGSIFKVGADLREDQALTI
jgi:hypothetical protein